MANLILAETTDEHISHVAHHMRVADVEEIWAAGRLTPIDALMRGVDRSGDALASALDANGVPYAIFGVAPVCHVTGTGSPWLLGTDAVLQHQRIMVEDSPFVIKLMLDFFPNLENYVHIKNRVSVRWLRRIGFEMDAPVQFPSGEWFMRFHMRRI